tara:strand:- start:61 stop:684 length:624 start_codon:yes stop_codon:yes gene_type:complete
MSNARYYASYFPEAEEVNPFITELVKKQKLDSVQRLKDGYRDEYPWRYFIENRNIKQIDSLLTWIESLIPQISYDFSVRSLPDAAKEPYLEKSRGWTKDKADFPWGGGGECGFDPCGFEIIDAWYMYYLKGEGIVEHNHFPYPLAFVYYVNTPEGCSSVILDGEELAPEAGQCLFFEGHLFHKVPAAPVDDRCVISGLISYTNHRYE